MNWVEVKGGKYELLEGKDKRSLCQIELTCRFIKAGLCDESI